MGQTLFDLLTGRNLELYAHDELRQQALGTVVVENPRGWRIAKEKSNKKIDAIVALAMACVAAMAHRGEIGSRSARGFNKSLHVAGDTLVPHHGQPIYIGQTLIDTPATVIAQCDRGPFESWRHLPARAWGSGGQSRPLLKRGIWTMHVGAS